MSNETSAQASVVQEDPDESSENIPPGVAGFCGPKGKKHLTPSALKDLRNRMLFSSGAGALNNSEYWIENETLPEVSSLLDDTWDDSVLALRNDSALPESPSTSHTSAFRTSLTPRFKVFNLAKKHPTPSALKDLMNTMVFSCGAGGSDAPEFWLNNETLPKVSFLDDTSDVSMVMNDSTLPDNAPSTPLTDKNMNATLPALLPPQLDSFSQLNAKEKTPNLKNITIAKEESEAMGEASSLRKNTSGSAGSLSLTKDAVKKPCESVDAGDVASHIPLRNDTFDYECSGSKDASLSETSSSSAKINCNEINLEMSKPVEKNSLLDVKSLDVGQDSELSLTSQMSPMDITKDLIIPDCVESSQPLSELNGAMKVSFEETSSVLEKSQSSLKPMEQTMDKLQTSAEDASDRQPASVIPDISSCSNISTLSSNSDIDCSSKVTEPHCEQMKTSSLESDEQDLHSGCCTNLAMRVSNKFGSAHVIFTPEQPSRHDPPTTLNTTESIQNQTLHLTPVIENSSKPMSEKTSSFASETSPVMHLNSSGSQKSSRNPVIGETFNMKNNTCECTPTKENANITSSQPNTVDKSSSKACNVTYSFEDATPLLQSNETAKAIKDPNANNIGKTSEDTFEGKSVLKGTFEAEKRESLNHSQSDVFLDSLNRQNAINDFNKARTFNLEDSLDLKEASLLTSTPMPNQKMFNLNVKGEVNQNLEAQRKLYEDVDNKPVASASSSDIPTNLVCVPKTFFKLPVSKSLFLAPRATSQLLKPKLTSAIAGPPSGLPMTRLRAQAESLRKLDIPKIPPATSKPSSSSNLRATASATIPATKTSLSKKHPLTRGDAFPSKRMKTDAEASTAVLHTKNLKRPTISQRTVKAQRDDAAVLTAAAEPLKSSDTGSKTRILKQPLNVHRALLPKAPGHGCANCVSLLKENKRLREELLEYRKQEEEEKASF
ncbi:uncharacterized protein LOC114481637 isoform X2 [Gouania willdenowi]|uniref:uncharacterized protein LOC114481637 isoform X2 n=1 Tax=Gouania willdenowi TaxID=441366 RepID=UPI0010554546|nr:uncharacterized protein LOC114481637 isoform X2 [Gouania willdenowi]